MTNSSKGNKSVRKGFSLSERSMNLSAPLSKRTKLDRKAVMTDIRICGKSSEDLPIYSMKERLVIKYSRRVCKGRSSREK
jgi:hypothetical protein